jgi:hypothetical protein
MSAVRRIDFVSDKVSNIILKGRPSDIILVNAHAQRDDKMDDMKDIFY